MVCHAWSTPPWLKIKPAAKATQMAAKMTNPGRKGSLHRLLRVMDQARIESTDGEA